jgi:O-antigen ligase
MTYYKRTLGIFVPFLIIGLVSAFQGIFPIISVHLMTLWLACASVCVVVAGGLNTRQVARLLFYSVLIELVLSIILAVLFKSVGTSHDSRVSAGVSWNGVFQGRILLGMMASWGLLLSLFRKYVGWIPSLVMAACAALCLYESHAAGDVVAAASSLAFAVAIMLLRRTTLSTVSKAWTLGLGSLAAVTGVLTLSPIILKALGRDATLTGRTEIWQAYIPRALERPILGQGPGSFSVPSQVTAELFYRLAQWGDIRTPHSMYIALLGEVGVLGLAAALGAWFYVAFVLPFRTQNLTTLICGAGAVLIMVNGFSESSMLYEPSLSLFIFLMLFASRNDAPKIAPNSRYARGLATVRSGMPGGSGYL